MPELRVHRSPWRDFPDFIIQTNMTKLKGHPAYRAAKEGDLDAALQVVESVCKPSKIPWAVDEIVAVAQIDRDKKNALPIAYALQLGDEMGVPVNNTVVQENIVSHTGADAPTRVLGQPIFNGTIGERKRILIIDDVVTFGATLANLRGFIHSRRSVVVGASTLSASYGATKLALPDHVKESLFERFPSVAEIAHGLGFEPDCFTNREGRFLPPSKNTKRVRSSQRSRLCNKPEHWESTSTGPFSDCKILLWLRCYKFPKCALSPIPSARNCLRFTECQALLQKRKDAANKELTQEPPPVKHA